MYKVKPTKKFRKDFKRIVSDKKLVDEISVVVDLLSANNNPLPEKYQDHQLKGKYAAYRECHVRPDWLLVYQKNKNELVLLLVRTNTHSEIFE
ncbi:MAG: type II toxin-antitoxin system YafQ family toxin [Tannerella sp.]|jgi:mRNA interferase YafQ|nr:type II toxin-antitoxin system YafQ family toxin [Tannerella sp.]